MAYSITKSDGTPVVIIDAEANTNFSIPLLGRNYANYGDEIAQSQLRMLENFANDSPPVNPTSGQIWYDTANKVMRVWEADSLAWKPVNVLVSTGKPSTQYNQHIEQGSLYYDTEREALFVNTGSKWKEVSFFGDVSTNFSGETGVGNPTLYGSRLRTIYLNDSLNIKRAVLAITFVNTGQNSGNYFNSEKIIAIFSGHDNTFTVQDQITPSSTDGIDVSFFSELTEPGGIGNNIAPGLNLRSDSPFGGGNGATDLANFANTAFSLNTGSYGLLEEEIPVENVYHTNKNLIPGTPGTYTIGTSSDDFSEAHITSIFTNNLNSPSGTLAISVGSGTVDISNEGNVTASGVFISSSDIKFKDNLEKVLNAPDRLLSVNGYTYTRNDKNNRREMGLVAQEVEKIFPEAVSDMPDGSKGVNYDSMAAVFVEAINDLTENLNMARKEIDTLQHRIKILEGKG